MKVDHVTLGAAGLALAASAAVYPWLPEAMPVHFDLAGRPDGFAPRAFGAFLLPAFALVTWGVARALRAKNPAVGLVSACIASFMLGLQVLVLRAALTGGDLGDALWLLLGAMFVAIGLIMPRVRRNRWVGVRTPWAMRSPEVWARTQRVGGAAMFVSGVILMLSLALSGPPAYAVRIFGVFVPSIVPIVYSWWASRTVSS